MTRAYATRAYGHLFTARTFRRLVSLIDAYATRHDLRAVSVVADPYWDCDDIARFSTERAIKNSLVLVRG